MDKVISDSGQRHYDWGDLVRSQCEVLGWCRSCTFDDVDPVPHADHYVETVDGHGLSVAFRDGVWGPVRVFPADLDGSPMSSEQASDFARGLYCAAQAADMYQIELESLLGDGAFGEVNG